MEESILSRLEDLRGEHARGVRRLEALSREFDLTRETVVRITGAIRVLEELLGADAEAGDLAGVEATAVGGGWRPRA